MELRIIEEKKKTRSKQIKKAKMTLKSTFFDILVMDMLILIRTIFKLFKLNINFKRILN